MGRLAGEIRRLAGILEKRRDLASGCVWSEGTGAPTNEVDHHRHCGVSTAGCRPQPTYGLGG